ncbi:MAG: hypothetical protein MMC33_001313 [Icmadophila ericetorum]|nr:hypothetical protein [Icmadophila ericetorum]
MGFTTSFFSGLTLTSTLLYISLLYHQNARAHQAALLYQQSLLLNSILDPDVIPVEDVPKYRLRRVGLMEMFKDRWNEEVEGVVRWGLGVRWGSVREAVERRGRAVWEGERRA